ncbi:hypothetical protein G4B88_008263 [Cannabis sativa]|uniref:Uncharacterized protein n=1 Tax=Cannabis sativa TaxID=3483 RepID=A0A7J6FLN5_CANSA|nr:hypothetical protein G4B88_008263 [Cannabis sativa]
MTSLSALKSLTIKGCLLIKSLPEGGLSVSLCGLAISYDVFLKMKWNWQALPHLTTLIIDGFGNEGNMESFLKEGLLPTSITSLEIHDFAKLRGLDKNGLTQLTSLQTLEEYWIVKKNEDMEQILKRLEYLANQIGNLNLEKNVVEVQLSGSSRAKTSLPDEPEIYGIKQYPLLSLPIIPCVTKMIIKNLENLESLYEAIKPRNPCSTLTPLQSLRLWDCGSSIRSLDMDLFPNLKTLEIYSSDYIEAITVSDGKSLEELTFLSIRNCDSFVSFPNGELIAPKLSVLEIFNCPKLKRLPEKMTSLSSLESLTIKYCPLIKSFPDGGLPVSLSSLDMSYGPVR